MTGYCHTNGVPKMTEAQGITPADLERMRSDGLSWPDLAERCGYRRRDYKAFKNTVRYHFRRHGRAWPIRVKHG